MNKINALRDYLLANTDIAPENLEVFIRDGSLSYAHHPTDRSFGIACQAHVIVTDFKGDRLVFFWRIISWLADNETAINPKEAVKFSADILDNETVDLEVLIDLNDAVQVIERENGTEIFIKPNPDIDKLSGDPSDWAMSDFLAGRDL